MNEAWLPFLEKHRHPTLRMQCKGPTCVMVFGMQRLGFSVLLLAPPSIIKRPGTNKAPIEINKQQYQPTVEMLKHTHTHPKKKKSLNTHRRNNRSRGSKQGSTINNTRKSKKRQERTDNTTHPNTPEISPKAGNATPQCRTPHCCPS